MGAFLTAIITTNTLEHGWGDLTRLFRTAPTAHEKTVDRFFDQVEGAEYWAHKPTIYESSKTFILRHYGALNPLEAHYFVSAPPLSPPELVVERAPLSPGQFIITYGRVVASNVLEATKGPYRSVIVQLIPASLHFPPRPSEADPVIYCRVPLEEVLVPAGATVFAEGVVVASGTVQSDQGGLRQAAYMDCAAIAPPAGRCGDYPLPPLPEAFEHCGPYAMRRYQERAVREHVYPHEASEVPYIEPR